MKQAREYELKFAIARDDLSRLAAHPSLASASERQPPARLNATYFDTPDCRLWSQGISLRVRDTDGRKTQTLKRAGASTINRGEWETDADGLTPSLDWIATTPLRRAFRHHVADRLTATFTVEVERTIFTVAQGSAEIEAALDRGEIQAGGRKLAISEVELELKRGEPADLFLLARALVSDVSMTPSLISKAERGYRLLDGSWGHPAKGAVASLHPRMARYEALQAIAEVCLHDMMLNVEAFATADDIETVHRSRVALRRLRAAMKLFGPLLHDAAFPRLKVELKWMSDLLGSARDLDVFQSEVFDPAAKDDAIPGGDELARHMRGKLRGAHAALADGLTSPRWRTALNDLIAWLADGAWTRAEEARRPLQGFAAMRLSRSRKQILKLGAGLEHLSPTERHHLRIEAKKLRYGLEFFAGTTGIGKGSKPFHALQGALETMQSSLGTLHDNEARQDLLRAEVVTWNESPGATDQQAAVAADLLAKDSPDTDALMAEAAKAYRKVKKSDPF